MGQGEIIAIVKDAIYTTIVCAAPMLIAAMAIGLIVSIFQATTQINEQTLAFVPKILGVLLALVLFGGLILNNLQDYTLRLFESISVYLR